VAVPGRAGGVDRLGQARGRSGEHVEAGELAMRVPSMRNRSTNTAWDQGVSRRVPFVVPRERRCAASLRAYQSQAARSTGRKAVYATTAEAQPRVAELKQ
jgi:hypothetical protein